MRSIVEKAFSPARVFDLVSCIVEKAFSLASLVVSTHEVDCGESLLTG